MRASLSRSPSRSRSLSRSFSLSRSLAPLAVLLLSACDAGASGDAGPIIVPDVGPIDVGSIDGGTDAPDGGDGTCGESISITGWGALPDTCLPRCTAATQAAYDACAFIDSACRAAALAADTTPPVRVRTYAGDFEVSCPGGGTTYDCLSWQFYACQADVCPAAYAAWTSCQADGTCTDEEDELFRCNRASPDFDPCIDERLDACFAD